MTDSLSKRLNALRRDYQQRTGRSFEHFFCPILQCDKPGELCRGHVINQAFRRSARTWTIQRTDVDGFFGTLFESEFVLLQERGQHPLGNVLADPTLARRFRPEIRVDGKSVEFYRPKNTIPQGHTEFLFQRGDDKPVRLALKMSPSEALATQASSWDVGFERDLRLPALVSLLKAAHLSMFSVLGYSWALASAGRFVGLDILGRFFDANKDRERAVVLEHAREHFREFINLVRPINSELGLLRGTVSDRYLYLCTGSEGPWAFMVLVRTDTDFHGVLLPVFEDAERSARYLRFMKDPAPRIQARLARFNGDRWEVSTTEQTLHWPEANWL